MADTKIAWAEKTWNPALGCTKVSVGCAHCYAIKNIWRMASNPNPKIADACAGLVKPLPIYFTGDPAVLGRQDEMNLAWTGKINRVPRRLEEPQHWKKPARVFVCSLSDWLHPDIPDEYVFQMIGAMLAAPWHRYLLLTKRPERIESIVRGYAESNRSSFIALPDYQSPLWFGVSAENQRAAEQRIPILMGAPVQHRWVSAEPLLGPLDLSDWLYPGGIEWVVAGCESGKDARVDNPLWYDRLIDRCNPPHEEKTPLFIKQTREGYITERGMFAALVHMPQIGGRVWDEYPPELVTK